MSTLGAANIAEFVDVVASEMANGTASAVERWMSEVDTALSDPRLTSLGRLYAAREVVEKYKRLTGKSELRQRPALRAS